MLSNDIGCDFPFKKKVSFQGNIIEVKSISSNNKQQTIKKISDDEYIVCSTGEVKEFVHGTDRTSNLSSINRTMNLIRKLVNTNVTNSHNARFVTLTYKENMTDTKRLYDDFRKFRQRINYYFTKNGIDKPEYISVCEPQRRGAWHMHIIFIWSHKAPFIPNKKLAEIWGHGFTHIRKIDNVDNVGQYLVAYLSAMPVDEVTLSELTKNMNNVVEKDIEENGVKVRKAFVKGARLKMYPLGMNIIRHSKGIKKPKEVYLNAKEVNELTKDYEKTYEKTIKLYDENTKFKTIIKTENYNRRRKKKI